MTLQNVRKARGLSQSQLAEKAGVSFRTIQHYEQGDKDINNAKLLTLCKLAEALDCKVSDIFNDDQKLIDLFNKVK